MSIRNHMEQFARFHIAYLCDHHQKQRILADIPVIRCQHIIRTLVQHTVQCQSVAVFFFCHVKCHRIRTGIQIHLVQILMHVDVRHDSSAVWIVFQIIQYTVDLIHHALFILVLYSQLIPVGLSYGSVFICPAIPNMAVQIVNIIRFFLPDPQDLIKSTFQCCSPKCQCRKFF